MTHPAIAALRRSHDQLRALVEPMGPADVRGPSYASEWTIAQVLSHLGSGAEIGALVLRTALAGDPSPGQDAYVAIWDTWNAKTPDAQAADAIPADRALVELYEGLDLDSLADLRVPLGPMQLDAVGLVRLRLGEHAAHTWDIAVMGDPTLPLDPAAADQLIDGIGMIVGFAGKPLGHRLRLRITTTGTDRELVLDATDGVSLTSWDGTEELPRLVVPAEAFLRLVFGRLDAAHTPPVRADDGVDLDDLRAVFPGF